MLLRLVLSPPCETLRILARRGPGTKRNRNNFPNPVILYPILPPKDPCVVTNATVAQLLMSSDVS